MTGHIALTALALVLIANILVSLLRVLRGPTARDRLTGILFAGTTGAAVLIISSVVLQMPPLRDVALALTALAAVIIVVRISAERRCAPASAEAPGGAGQHPEAP